MNDIHPKVLGGGAGAVLGQYIGVIIVWLISLTPLQLPSGVQDAITGICSLAASLGLGWLSPAYQSPTGPVGPSTALDGGVTGIHDVPVASSATIVSGQVAGK